MRNCYGCILSLLLLCCLGWPALYAGDANTPVMLSRSKAAALLTALFYHDESSQGSGGLAVDSQGIEGSRIGSASPKQMSLAGERSKILAFASSLVYEGGYYPQEIYQLLGYGNPNAARIARLTRQLDKLENKTPSPWEVVGRVGKSGMSGSSDNWAMAPADDGGRVLDSPGTLAYLPTLAIVYAAYLPDGMEAAAQLATLKDDDMRAAPAARAAFSLLSRVLVATGHDKDAWLRYAGEDSQDSETDNDVRSVRIKDWRYLRGEECAMGRLERSIYIWYKSETYNQTMSEGRKLLRSRESLAYLAALTAATYGMEGLPKRVIASATSDRQLLEAINDLHDLATSDAVLRVSPAN